MDVPKRLQPDVHVLTWFNVTYTIEVQPKLKRTSTFYEDIVHVEARAYAH